MNAPYLSVVIPAFNEARRLPRTLERVALFLRGFQKPYEIVVVDDGSADTTGSLAREVGGDSLVLARNDTNRGKGYSVRRGMLLARGERRLMTDADLSTPMEELPRLMTLLDEGYDVAIGSRALPGSSIEVRQGRLREGMGR
ncbi:MAG TPA: glycosyltransferase, partial [Vicinamibacteria bacterium]|nr:glycosyltransferase [Vicinamibacteria bacterium]